MYKVVKFFTDLQDDNHAYHVGDIFPREGVEVSEDRLKELSTDKNKRGEVLIEEVVEDIPADESEDTEEKIPTEEAETTEEDIPEESPEDAKEEPLDKKADVDSPKKPKTKKTPKNA